MKDSKKTPIALREEDVLKFWQENDIFNKSVEKDLPAQAGAPNGEYTFYDGPPFATGTPHYGHLLQSFVKDAVPRYKTMRGYRVARQWGWDCHGLPIENIVEKELGISGREDIERIGVKKFNDTCREKIFEYVDVWERIIPRIGRWADMKGAYKTMDTSYMESEWWAFKQLYDKGLIYESYRSMHICPRCETTLSQSEVTEGYKDVKDLSVIAKFELVDDEALLRQGSEGQAKTYVLAWTTTPWTLPGNVALAVGKDIEYVKVSHEDAEYIVAKELAEKIFSDKEYGIKGTFKGTDLVGKAYKPLFDYYAKDTSLENRENGWKIYAADFVTTDEGTGVVHIAPAFGEDDMNLGKAENLPFVQHVAMDGHFKPETDNFAGLDLRPRAKNNPEEIREADLEIVRYLKEHNKVFDSKKYLHSYPHCWRCDTPLLNYATTSWFVAVEKMKNDLLKTAEPINWSPKHIKEGRWGNWLEGARDWSISRQRYWANTMPVWRCDSCEHEAVFGSIEELEKASGVKVDDLHKDVVDEVKWECKCGGAMSRIPDVLDTWFDSGSVPYATLHYPFENEEAFKERLPIDFIGEAQDQTRAWFYYLHVLSGGLFNSRAFNNCIVTGMVLAEDGKKMSKKLQNYPDPMYMVNKYGADAMRLYILSSPVVRTESLNFSEKEVGEVSRKIFGRLVNVYEFYALYKDSAAHTSSSDSTNVLDRWILSRVHELHAQVTKSMEDYELDRATRGMPDFVDDFSTWYIRRSRDRFKGEDEKDKQAALATTAYVLREFAKLLAPFAPFHAEWLWHELRTDEDEDLPAQAGSVHLSAWSEMTTPESEVLEQMAEARKLVTLALDARKDANTPVRQPLAKLKIKNKESGIENSKISVLRDSLKRIYCKIRGKEFCRTKFLNDDLLQIIADEVNVKEVVFDTDLKGEVELDTNITPELKEEGDLRELIRAIQGARKEAKLKPGEMTDISVAAPKETQELAEKHKEEIAKQAFVSEIAFIDGEELDVRVG